MYRAGTISEQLVSVYTWRIIFTVWSNIAFGPLGRSWMTRGGLTFTLKSEPSISTVRLNRQGGECKCVDYSRARQLLQICVAVVLERGRDGGRGELQGWWWMRGSISNDGLSGALSQRGRQATGSAAYKQVRRRWWGYKVFAIDTLSTCYSQW